MSGGGGVDDSGKINNICNCNSLISKIFNQNAQNKLPVLDSQILKYNPQCTIP